MVFDNDELRIIAALDGLGDAAPELMPGIREKLGARPRRRVRYVVAAIVAAALLITGCAALGAFDWLLGVLGGGGFTDVVEPVEQSVTDHDIKFTVIAAQRYGDMAMMYVSVQDTSGKGRVTESSGINVRTKDHDITMVSDMVYFDEETDTAVYTLSLDLGHGHDGNAVELEMFQMYIDYDDHTMPLTKLDVDIEGFDEAPDIANEPGAELEIELGADIPELAGFRLGPIGKLEGKPFVQLVSHLDGDHKMFSPVAYVMSADGERYNADVRIMAVDENFVYTPLKSEYMVYTLVFDAPPEDIEGGELYFGGRYHPSVVGEWKLDVELREKPLQLDYVIDIPIGDTVIEDVKVSATPVGLSFEGVAPSGELTEKLIYAIPVLSDGEADDPFRGRAEYENLDEGVKFNCWCYYESTIMPEEVIGLRFGDEVVMFAQS